MKKIVGILGMAAVLGSMAFAAEPAANFVMTEFSGSAGFGVYGDFIPEQATFGMFNENSANLKFGFISAGDKITTGSGVWGELKIKLGDATTIDNGTVKLGDNASKGPLYNKPVVDTAKIHFVDGDFNLALNIAKPELSIADVAAPAATGVNVTTSKIDLTLANPGKDKYSAGFGIELGMDKLFNFNFKFMDKGMSVAAKDQKYGLAFDASLLAVENLTAKVAAAFNFETKENAFGAEAGYKLPIDDKLYVNTGVAFNMDKKENQDAVNGLEAGVLFGWGASGIKPEFEFLAKTSDKFAEGVSVGYGTNLKDTNKIVAGLYDQSLMSLLGVDFITLKTGASFGLTMAKDKTDKVTNTIELLAGAKAAFDFDPVYLNLNADFSMSKVGDAEATTHYLINAKVGSKKIIDNTDLYLEYNVGDKASTNKKLDTHNIKVGTTISF